MLVRLEVENFRSIADPVTLSMVAIDADRDAARDQPRLGEHLLTRAAIYGANASGKSTVVAALAWLRDGVRGSLRFWEEEIPVDPFAFGAWPERPTRFVVEMTIDGIRFDYEVELTRERVEYEALHEYPERRRRKVFEREGDTLTLARGLGSLTGARALLTPRTLALSAMRRFDDTKVGAFADALVDVQTLGFDGEERVRGHHGYVPEPRRAQVVLDLFSDDGDRLPPPGDGSATVLPSRTHALSLLRMADLGVEDVVVTEDDVPTTGDVVQVRRRLQLVHRAGRVRMPFDLAAESQGTRAWLALIGPLLAALDTGGLLVVDELDASLHPSLSVELLRLFADRATNPRNAQLVFTSHDATLLNHLNRDEVWLTEKGPDGATRLGALSEFAGERVRRSQNLESAYLHGRFGALPDVDRSGLLQALGLIG